jgi:adenylate cyclase
MAGNRKFFRFLVPIAIIGIFALFELSGLSERVGEKAYDLLLRLGPSVAAGRDILLLDVDDRAIASKGDWPWSRDTVADGLVLLKEMDAQYVLLALPFGKASPSRIDPAILEEALPEAFEREFSRIEENIQTLFDAIRRGSVRPKDSPQLISDLIGLVASGKSRLLEAAAGRKRDEDAVLGKAARILGRTYVTLEIHHSADQRTDQEVEDSAIANLAIPNFSLSAASASQDPSLHVPAVRLPLLPLAIGAAGGGFVSFMPDEDRVLRRAALIAKCDERHFGQIAFAALLDRLGNPAVQAGRGSIVLRKAAFPGMRARDIVIPLTEDGSMLIDWPRIASGDGFRRLSWNALALHSRLEKELLAELRKMERVGYLFPRSAETALLELYDYSRTLRDQMVNSGSSVNAAEWRNSRERFFALVDALVNGEAEMRIRGELEKSLSSAILSAGERKAVETARDGVPGAFAEARRTFSSLQRVRALLRENATGSFIIVSLAASAAADRHWLTPLGDVATEGAASAALVSTVLAGRPLREIPSRYALVLGAVLSLLAAGAVFRLKASLAVLIGAGSLCVISAAISALFFFTGLFLNPFAPAASVALTSLGMSGSALLSIQREKRAIRSRFAGRLSPILLGRLVKENRMPLDSGERRLVTVLSARVMGFPADDAQRHPREIARVFADYHSTMSEIIRASEGTIGRAEGDTINAFFGAPIKSEDHARKACFAALEMKKAESELNKKLLAENRLAAPLVSRIGIDSGECVAGDLGLQRGTGYAVAGGAADFAARLARLNARYATAILVSDSVSEAGREEFLLRRLDSISRANSEAPARIFELIAAKNTSGEAFREAVEAFHQGLSRLEERDWEEAERHFRKVLALVPGDGPASVNLRRCHEARSRRG